MGIAQNMDEGLTDSKELEPWEKLLVQKHFPTPPLNDLVRLDGDLVMPCTLLPLLERIQDLPLRPDDVWVVSYPKCGTTWTQEMVWMILNNLDMENGQLPLVIRSPFLEFGCILPPTEGENRKTGETSILGEVDHLLSSFLADPIEFTNGLSGGGRRRLIKTHLPLAFLPPNLLTTCKACISCQDCLNGDNDPTTLYHDALCQGDPGDAECEGLRSVLLPPQRQHHPSRLRWRLPLLCQAVQAWSGLQRLLLGTSEKL